MFRLLAYFSKFHFLLASFSRDRRSAVAGERAPAGMVRYWFRVIQFSQFDALGLGQGGPVCIAKTPITAFSPTPTQGAGPRPYVAVARGPATSARPRSSLVAVVRRHHDMALPSLPRLGRPPTRSISAPTGKIVRLSTRASSVSTATSPLKGGGGSGRRPRLERVGYDTGRLPNSFEEQPNSVRDAP